MIEENEAPIAAPSVPSLLARIDEIAAELLKLDWQLKYTLTRPKVAR